MRCRGQNCSRFTTSNDYNKKNFRKETVSQEDCLENKKIVKKKGKSGGAVQNVFVMLNQEVEPTKEEGVKVTAKEYLLQIKEQKQNIRKQEEYIQRLRDSLTIAGISYDKERIQSSPDPDKFAKIFGQINEEEQRLEDMKTRFVNTRVKIINQIHQLAEEKHQNVLYLMYVDDKTLKKASQEMCFSYEYVKKLHGAALQAFDLMFPPQSA